jgi:hypothetical protein
MATNLGHDDVTITLDELYANNTVEQLLPMDELLKHWRQVSRGSAKNINARGAFYMLQSQQPAYIRQKSFGTTPGAQFPEPTKSKYTTMNLSAIVDEATLQWDGNVDDQNDAALKQKPAKDLDYIERELEGITSIMHVSMPASFGATAPTNWPAYRQSTPVHSPSPATTQETCSTSSS